MFKLLGVAIIALALVTGIVPHFTDCQSQGKAITLANGRTVPMKCHWTGQAETALAIPVIAVGAMMAFSRKRETRLNLGLLGVTMGVLAIMLPTSIIGTCSSEMLCKTVMKPTLVTMGSFIVAASVVGMVLAWRRADKP